MPEDDDPRKGIPTKGEVRAHPNSGDFAKSGSSPAKRAPARKPPSTQPSKKTPPPPAKKQK